MGERGEATLEEVAAKVRVCTLCPLSESRTHAVPGEGPVGARVMLVGEAPGGTEDRQGRPFVGSAGQNLNSLLERAGMARESVFITNTVKCRPPANRKPAKEELAACRPYLLKQIELVEPEIVVLLGDTALKSFFPDAALGSSHGKLKRLDSRSYFPTYHPASMIYNRSLKEVMEDDFAKLGALLNERE